MSGKNSRARRKLAVKTARDFVYGKDVDETLKGFDERQMRIYNKYIPHFQNVYNYCESMINDMGG